MSAVEIIKANLDVEKILDYYNAKGIAHYGDFIRCCCPIHNGDNPTAFVMNTEKGLWSCKTNDCGDGDIFTLVEKMEDMNFPQAVQKVAEILGIDINNMVIVQRKDSYQKELEEFRKYINAKRKKKEITEFSLDTEVKQVKKFRNFKPETLKHFELGYVSEVELEKKSGGYFQMYERLVIPIYQNGVKVGVSLRKMRAQDNPKWFHAPHTMETGQIIYNIDNCIEDAPIIVCEGMFDVWGWYEAGYTNAVCTFGAHVTKEQYRMLLRTGKDLIWSFDGDVAGINATKSAIEMFKYKATQWVINFEEGQDPGNCEIEVLQNLYKNKEKVR